MYSCAVRQFVCTVAQSLLIESAKHIKKLITFKMTHEMCQAPPCFVQIDVTNYFTGTEIMSLIILLTASMQM
jgi:hypothetical protein